MNVVYSIVYTHTHARTRARHGVWAKGHDYEKQEKINAGKAIITLGNYSKCYLAQITTLVSAGKMCAARPVSVSSFSTHPHGKTDIQFGLVFLCSSDSTVDYCAYACAHSRAFGEWTPGNGGEHRVCIRVYVLFHLYGNNGLVFKWLAPANKFQAVKSDTFATKYHHQHLYVYSASLGSCIRRHIRATRTRARKINK